MTLSILIINWNSKDYLRRCLHTVVATCGGLNPQVVVVDGGSYDGCAEMLATEFPSVEFIQSELNLGFGGSNNLGLPSVTGDMLLLLNPDTELEPGAIPELMQQLTSLPDAGLLGPRLLNSDGTLQASCVQSLPTVLNQFFDSNFLRRLFPNSSLWGTGEAFSSTGPVEVEAVSGACMLLRTSVFRALRGFSPEFFFYGEDMDLCARLRKAGKKIYHAPGAKVTHHGGVSTTNQVSKFSTVHFRQSILIFIRKHRSPRQAWIYRLLMFWNAIFRLGFLLPARKLVRAETANRMHGGVNKWIAVLRWSLGLESWVARSIPGETPAARPQTAS